jgi:hypothetical protein
MKTELLKNYQVVFTKDYTTSSAANRAVRLYEKNNGVQNNLSNRKQFLVEKNGPGDYTVTLFNLRRKLPMT